MMEMSAEELAEQTTIASRRMCFAIRIMKKLGLELNEVQKMLEILWDKEPCNP